MRTLMKADPAVELFRVGQSVRLSRVFRMKDGRVLLAEGDAPFPHQMKVCWLAAKVVSIDRFPRHENLVRYHVLVQRGDLSCGQAAHLRQTAETIPDHTDIRVTDSGDFMMTGSNFVLRRAA